MALVYNYKEDITVIAFISGLQVTTPFYKYLVKNGITKMRDIFVRVQKYTQIEEAVFPRDRVPRSKSQSHSSPKKEPKP